LLLNPIITGGPDGFSILIFYVVQNRGIKLSEMTGENFLAADLDRIFWHFGKTICQSKPKCSDCPIKPNCLTGKYKAC